MFGLSLWNRKEKSSKKEHDPSDLTLTTTTDDHSSFGCLPSIRKSKKSKHKNEKSGLVKNEPMVKSEYDDVCQYLTIPKRYTSADAVDVDCCLDSSDASVEIDLNDRKLSLEMCESDSATTITPDNNAYLLCGESESNISNISVDTPPPQCADSVPTKKTRQPLRIVFLDIDGVLRGIGSGYQLSEDHLKRLKRVLDSVPFVKVVLSSSWRLHTEAKQFLFEQLVSRVNVDIDYYFLGETPHFHNLLSRSYEILNYVDMLQTSPTYQLLNWIAIDDLPLNRMGSADINAQLSGHFLKTNGKMGLTEDDCKTVIAKLLSNDSVVGSVKQPKWSDVYHSNSRVSVSLPTTDENLQY